MIFTDKRRNFYISSPVRELNLTQHDLSRDRIFINVVSETSLVIQHKTDRSRRVDRILNSSCRYGYRFLFQKTSFIDLLRNRPGKKEKSWLLSVEVTNAWPCEPLISSCNLQGKDIWLRKGTGNGKIRPAYTGLKLNTR